MASSKSKKEIQPASAQPKAETEVKNNGKVVKSGILFLIFVLLLGAWLYYALEKKPQKPIIPPRVQTERVLKPIARPAVPAVSAPKAEEHASPTAEISKPVVAEPNRQAYIESLQAEIKQLKNQIETLSHQNIEEKKYADALLGLYDAVQNGRPFKKELGRVLKINSADPLALSIEEKAGVWAATGIPTLTELQRIFNEESHNAEQSFYIHPQMSWQDEIIAFFKSVIRVRPLQVSQKELKGVALLYAASDELKAGHLDLAVTYLNKLPAAEKMLLRTFIRQAEMRLQMNTLLQQYLNHSGE